MRGDITTLRRTTNSYAQPLVSRVTKFSSNTAQTVVAAMATTDLDAQATECQVNFVMNHNQIPRFNAEGLTSWGDTGATAIHICLGQQDCCFVSSHPADTVKTLVAVSFQSNSCPFCQARGHHKTNVVACFGILIARVAQPDDQFQQCAA